MRWLSLGLLLVACGGPPARKVIENRPASVPPVAPSAEIALPTGRYACALESDGYRYDEFVCVVERQGESLRLDKLSGSQRFRGTLSGSGDELVFEGEFFCPWGDCDERVTGRFRPVGGSENEGRWDGELEGPRAGAPIRVFLRHAPGFGGDGYGGTGADPR